ncbi:similar to Saccharomyces cerevisiae YPL237W SUI3 Beta subunit of the translation initiation factor eIF2, involved in the identification of the start codon [Maudiozyma barnettii]|uniref:Similar to Saccharomyces cerevisiae YPL237W SUI3 Beta subunit of the translation initiation factor eIF2, involved in the identification of the start codon n=1 Tax=Maudiozyma barnettii TaxID=61262 RepID=A0A8H2ZIC3_9SACH|nr:translation initiation factor eIF2 subunit beta [Kazachstania barnettii]CAB4255377.1 similar to Saccharomyces cerevisiae YPL237W SUI3 Beta subunit of the translation initiation factor eIF2, involved in the identification of the start codon [Kazachstania barnettii]CAD1783783.1 similar to Saccharomyces cerevisiae YPL237W SUI3 Beta subunit of the translation initiation factor eIF2, involved in the identification of the start codon [Kazachstania barnettii]
MSSDLANDLGFDPTLKKKKKSKKVAPDFDAASATDSTETTNSDDLFSGMKKKKKKSKSTSKDTETAEGDVDEVSEALGELSLKKKKKKSKEPVSADDFEKELAKAGISTDGVEGSPAPESSAQQEAGLPYSDLLSRFFNILRANNPELAGDRSGPKFRIPPPVCLRDGKKTIFSNIQDISEKLQRSPDHLIQYLFAELGTSGSIDGQKRLVIKGKFLSKQMENVLRRYILEYVTCKTCKSINTELKKEQSNRLYFLVCKSCGSTRSVSSIKTGFQATVGKRRRM